jgi:hypothetical protein
MTEWRCGRDGEWGIFPGAEGKPPISGGLFELELLDAVADLVAVQAEHAGLLAS